MLEAFEISPAVHRAIDAAQAGEPNPEANGLQLLLALLADEEGRPAELFIRHAPTLAPWPTSLKDAPAHKVSLEDICVKAQVRPR